MSGWYGTACSSKFYGTGSFDFMKLKVRQNYVLVILLLLLTAGTGAMLSCLMDTKKCSRLSRAKNISYTLLCNSDAAHQVTSSTLSPVDAAKKNSFFQQLSLAPSQSSSISRQPRNSIPVECEVIVIDDDDDNDIPLVHLQNSCIADLFGTARPLRDVVNGNHTSRLLQPCGRLRKLLTIDVSSPLGSRTLKCVLSALKSDGGLLNPYTVTHTLGGSDNTLEYNTFCRTPVKGVLNSRLRHREYPVRYRPMSAGTHYHYYCFSRSDRRKFCRRFDTGLNSRSRQLKRKYNHCAAMLERLTEEEVSDWRSSERLREYVTRMEEKDKQTADKSSPQVKVDSDVISLSSDSEDEFVSSVKKQDLTFRCHQCNVKIPCGDTFQSLVRDHYRTCHGIFNVDIIRIVQPDGSMTMHIVHVTTTVQSPCDTDVICLD